MGARTGESWLIDVDESVWTKVGSDSGSGVP